MRERKWVNTLLEKFFAGELKDKSIQACIKKMKRRNRKLYKYYNLNSQFTMTNLRAFQNYYENPTKFNDPFDCNIGMSIDQLLESLLPLAIKKCFPAWSDNMIAVAYALLLGKVKEDDAEASQLAFLNISRDVQAFREIEEAYNVEKTAIDSQMIQAVFTNPKLIKNALMCTTGLPARLSESEVQQLVDCFSDFLQSMQMRIEVNENNFVDTLQDTFAFFERESNIIERLVASAKTLGVDINEMLFEQVYNQCISNLDKVHSSLGQKVGITCFSQRWDNILMWSHYANKHTGICVEYDFDIPFDTSPNSLLLPIRYTSERPLIPIDKVWPVDDASKENAHDKRATSLAFTKALISKSNVWKYEQEWRHIVFLSEQSTRLVELPIVSKIIMGVNISEENRKVIADFAAKKRIALYQTHMKEDKYEMILKRVL